MTWLLVWLKQRAEALIPRGGVRFWFYVLVAALLAWGIVSLSGCITYRNVGEVRTFGGFLVTGVDGGTQAQEVPESWLENLRRLLGSVTWLAVVGGLILLVLAWKAPSLFQRIKDRRAAKAALKRS